MPNLPSTTNLNLILASHMTELYTLQSTLSMQVVVLQG
jgi:hypothetical protein